MSQGREENHYTFLLYSLSSTIAPKSSISPKYSDSFNNPLNKFQSTKNHLQNQPEFYSSILQPSLVSPDVSKLNKNKIKQNLSTFGSNLSFRPKSINDEVSNNLSLGCFLMTFIGDFDEIIRIYFTNITFSESIDNSRFFNTFSRTTQSQLSAKSFPNSNSTDFLTTFKADERHSRFVS